MSIRATFLSSYGPAGLIISFLLDSLGVLYSLAKIVV